MPPTCPSLPGSRKSWSMAAVVWLAAQPSCCRAGRILSRPDLVRGSGRESAQDHRPLPQEQYCLPDR